jgi:peptide chain release factor subunit 1
MRTKVSALRYAAIRLFSLEVNVMKLTNLIKVLGAFEPDGFPFLSLYLNAEANETGRENFHVWLKKALSEQGKKYDENPFEAARFDAAAELINGYLEKKEDPSANGIAIFTSLGQDFFEAAQLDVPFAENAFFSYDRPHIFPLAKAVWQNPKYAVLWADTNKADIYIFGGETQINQENQESDRVEFIQNQFTHRPKVGGWSQSRYQRHIDNFHLQHAKETVAELEKLMRDKEIDKLILCGDEATIMPILRPQLSKAVEEKVVGTLNLSQYASTEEIHQKTLETMGIENATQDQKQVGRVFNAANAKAGMGTLGLEATFAALSAGQVQELAISSDLDAIQYAPGDVERIWKAFAPGDDKSPVDTIPIVQLAGQVADQLIIRAVNSDAKVFFIEDASLLKDVGGIGAVLRYNANAQAGG